MALSKNQLEKENHNNSEELTATKKRRLRRKKLHAAKQSCEIVEDLEIGGRGVADLTINVTKVPNNIDTEHLTIKSNSEVVNTKVMSSKEEPSTRGHVIAAREAKKLAKLKAKKKDLEVTAPETTKKSEKDKIPLTKTTVKEPVKEKTTQKDKIKENVPSKPQQSASKSKDEVDRAVQKVEDTKATPGEKTKEQILAERAAKKANKQVKKKGLDSGDILANPELTLQDVVETLKDIKIVAQEVQDITAKVSAINFADKQPSEDSSKSKAELKAERRAKQEAQRAAKQVAVEKAKPKPEEAKPKPDATKPDAATKEKSPKPKSDKAKQKTSMSNRINWFQHLNIEDDKEVLKKVPINSNLHPAIVKLGVQLTSRVIEGSNARCVALLDALKKMVRDYSLPAKTEFGRGLEAQLAASLAYLWGMRPPCASQTNALKFFRHHLTQLPNNVDEFDAKKILQEEIDKYIEDQIDTAGEAISLAVRNKISDGDNILIYGSSSLVERILVDAFTAGAKFRAVVCGARTLPAARALLRRLAARGLPATYLDITALSFVIHTINKVLLGASSLLANGSVLCCAGAAAVALAARARNVPVLVACETHNVSERVQTDAFVYNEIGDPDDLIDKSDENSPLKDWRSNPNLTPLNLLYDVTPPSLVTAVVTEKAILPCTSAPVVLRTKLSGYGI